MKKMVMLDGKLHRLVDYSEKMKKSEACKIDFFGIEFVLPYNGKLDKAIGKYDNTNMPIGIYTRKNSKIPYIRLPLRKDRHKFSMDGIKDLTDLNILNKAKYKQSDIDLTVDGEKFSPPLHIDDDPLNHLIKVGITSKGLNFDSYGIRLQEMEVGTNPESRKTNAKKALMNNRTMTPTKGGQFAGPFDLKIAYVIANSPNAVHPMKYSPLVIFPNGEFSLEGAVNVEDITEEVYNDNK